MNKELIKEKAIALELLLKQYSSESQYALGLANSLKCIIEDAKLMRIDSEMDWGDIPGSRLFNEEGDLRKYTNLEDAYAQLKIELTGGETPALRYLRSLDNPN